MGGCGKGIILMSYPYSAKKGAFAANRRLPNTQQNNDGGGGCMRGRVATVGFQGG